MNKTNSIIFTSASLTRARSFAIKSHTYDFSQYANTVRAYTEAGMPFDHIANAGDFLGDIVERQEIDAPIQNGWQTKSREIAEDENKILAWQNRGENVSNVHQITSASTGSIVTGREMVVISQDLTTISAQNKVNVIEGIDVSTKKNPNLPENNRSEPANNYYLNAVPFEYKKAA